MLKSQSMTMPRVLTLLAGLVVIKVTVAVMLGYVNYLPPEFSIRFLAGA